MGWSSAAADGHARIKFYILCHSLYFILKYRIFAKNDHGIRFGQYRYAYPPADAGECAYLQRGYGEEAGDGSFGGVGAGEEAGAKESDPKLYHEHRSGVGGAEVAGVYLHQGQ